MTDAEILDSLYERTLAGDAPEAAELATRGVREGLGPEAMLYGALVPSLQEAAARLERGEAFVPEVLGVARAAQRALEVLQPLLPASAIRGDVRDAGTRLAAAMLAGARYDELFTARFAFRA